MTDEELSEIITFALITWPGQPSMPLYQRIVGWRPFVGDLDQRHVHAAIVQLGCEGDRFPPPPGLIRKRAVAFTTPVGSAPGPEEAWAEIKTKIGSVGYTTALDLCDRCLPLEADGRRECDHRWVTFSHPAIQAFVDSLGWKYLCQSQDEMADRAHFVKWYPAAVDRLSNQAALPEAVKALASQVVSALPVGESAT